MRFVKPLDAELLTEVMSSHQHVVTIEENTVIGGLGAAVLEWQSVHAEGPRPPVTPLGIPDRFIDHAGRDEQLATIGLVAADIRRRVRQSLACQARTLESGAN
jgi:1-deoxy-D-xylulose-5-phosphate synthase